MNIRQRTFCSEYLKDLNATQAAIRAGYAEVCASVTGTRLLANDSVKALIQERMTRRAERVEVTIERVVAELAKIGFASLAKFTRLDGENVYIDFCQATEDDLAVISEIVQEEYTDGKGENARDIRRTKIKLHPKLPALEQLMKHLLLSAGKPTERLAIDAARAALSGNGLDPSRYTDAQLRAIEEFATVIDARPTGVPGHFAADRPAGVEPPGEG